MQGMGALKLLTIVLWSCGGLTITSSQQSSCASLDLPRVTVNRNTLRLYNTEPLHVALPSGLSDNKSNVLVTMEIDDYNMTRMTFVLPREDNDVLFARCENVSSCFSGSINLLEYFKQSSNEVEMLLKVERLVDNCQVNRTIVFSVESHFMRGPALIVLRGDLNADIHWNLPDFIDFVDVTCCGNNSVCSRATIRPAVNATVLELPEGAGGLYQFDFYLHDNQGHIRTLIADPRFLIYAPGLDQTTTGADNSNLGWIIFLSITLGLSLIVIAVLAKKVADGRKAKCPKVVAVIDDTTGPTGECNHIHAEPNYTLIPTQCHPAMLQQNGLPKYNFYTSYADMEFKEANLYRESSLAKLHVRKMASLLKIKQDLLSSSHDSTDDLLVVEAASPGVKHYHRYHSDGQLGIRSGNINVRLVEDAQRDVSEVLLLRKSANNNGWCNSPA